MHNRMGMGFVSSAEKRQNIISYNIEYTNK